jgi:hypothetical protein
MRLLRPLLQEGCSGSGSEALARFLRFPHEPVSDQREHTGVGKACRGDHRCLRSPHSAIKLRDGVEQLLPPPFERLDGDDRVQAALSPEAAVDRGMARCLVSALVPVRSTCSWRRWS